MELWKIADEILRNRKRRIWFAAIKTIIEPFEEICAPADNQGDGVRRENQEGQGEDRYEKNRK